MTIDFWMISRLLWPAPTAIVLGAIHMQSSCWMVGTYGEEMMVDDHCPHSKCVTFVGPSVGNS